ncbi:Uncharacterized protein NF27_GC00040 [Candidatus Jidaibacter acanthamoeba]|uniref:Uncharacterized protein n=1 Tax=Candidatus Jidaibacter acanthamoebae TaxID=86105 RepID=A0A0C1QXH8_9RICK|nr:hypothetical protein [Candidatus Jidaibacter acanthamoeba]KIE04725.1 Uncharacterized protein NF27_GC00040 [Candidatus Jidaibacter acanthamoeba]
MSKECNKYKYYLMDLGPGLKKFALEAKEDFHNHRDNKFKSGYYSAFHRVISYIMQQAEGFGIDVKELGLDDIDPDKDLIS